MSQVLRWALLSTANINKALLEPLRHSPRSELVAVASRDGGRADNVQAERDAEFLAHVREDVGFLLDEIERLKKEADNE